MIRALNPPDQGRGARVLFDVNLTPDPTDRGYSGEVAGWKGQLASRLQWSHHVGIATAVQTANLYLIDDILQSLQN